MDRGRGALLRREQERPRQPQQCFEHARPVLPEAGRHPARMQAVGGDARSLQAFGQRIREEDVRQLGLAVGADAAIALLALQIVEVDDSTRVHGRSDVDDSRRGARLQEFEQFLGEQEIAQMIQGPGALEAVGRRLPTREDAAGIVHEDVEPRIPGLEFTGQPAHFGQRRQVGWQICNPFGAGFPADRFRGSARAGRITTHDHDMGPSAGKAQGGFLADARGRTGDQADLALHGLKHGNDAAYDWPTGSNAFRTTASSLTPERIIRNLPDQTRGTCQRPSISVPSSLNVPS